MGIFIYPVNQGWFKLKFEFKVVEFSSIIVIVSNLLSKVYS